MHQWRIRHSRRYGKERRDHPKWRYLCALMGLFFVLTRTRLLEDHAPSHHPSASNHHDTLSRFNASRRWKKRKMRHHRETSCRHLVNLLGGPLCCASRKSQFIRCQCFRGPAGVRAPVYAHVLVDTRDRGVRHEEDGSLGLACRTEMRARGKYR